VNHEVLRKLPSIDTLLRTDLLTKLIGEHGKTVVIGAARAELDKIRRQILQTGAMSNQGLVLHVDDISQNIANQIRVRLRPTLQPIINATGVIIHTNLGRALLSRRAKIAMHEAASAYSNLEYDLEAGRRGSRYIHAESLLCQLTGAESAVVVNNNAAALVLCLSTLAKGHEVLISRSQLVEIGGGFRIPEIMHQSGAKLVEVGSTNRTYLHDYETHLNPSISTLILRVHHSNFKIIGFTHEPGIAELAALGKKHGIIVMDDLGSGTLLDTTPFGLAHEPTIQESIHAGVDIVTASGDKLLGGPQAGLIMGQKAIIAKLRKHPLIRAFRVDKITLAALQATLLAYLENKAITEVPVWQMIALDIETINLRARYWQKQCSQIGLHAEVVDAYSTVGGGSLPGQQLPTKALAIETNSPDTFTKNLRLNTPPVIACIENNCVMLDPRTVLAEQDDDLLRAVRKIEHPY